MSGPNLAETKHIRDKEARERFIQEAQAAAALDHPNICTVHEIDEVNGQTFIPLTQRNRILFGFQECFSVNHFGIIT
jgi:serine/threonine protein kinase